MCGWVGGGWGQISFCMPPKHKLDAMLFMDGHLLDFGTHSTSEPFYEDEAVKKVTSIPVYNNNARQTTYKYENELLPVRSENQVLEPEPPRRTRQSLYVPEPSPDYYR